MASQASAAIVDEEVLTVDVQKAKDLISSGHVYLDVRTEDEYKKGHVAAEKIHNIPYMFSTPQGRVKNPNFLEQVLSVCNKDDSLVVGCQTGVRSLYATVDLQKAGFNTVCNMGGGYVDWAKIGFQVAKPRDEKEEQVALSRKEESVIVAVSDVNAKKPEAPVAKQNTKKDEELVTKEEEVVALNDKEDAVISNVVEIGNDKTDERVA